MTPNPFTAGIAKWNILAAYGAQRHLGKTNKQAIAFIKKLFDHVVSQDSSGSNPDEHVPLGQGRRPDHVRERGDQRAAAAGTSST